MNKMPEIEGYISLEEFHNRVDYECNKYRQNAMRAVETYRDELTKGIRFELEGIVDLANKVQDERIRAKLLLRVDRIMKQLIK